MASILFVVANTTLSVNDQTLADFLRTSLGHTVTTQAGTSAPSFTGHDLVVISESVISSNPATYASDYLNTTVPIVCFENGLWDELNFGTGSGTEIGNTTLVIADGTSQVAAGYTGTQTYLTSAVDQKYLIGAAAGVNVVAETPVGSHPLVFTVESGATLTTGTAASRRVGIGWLEEVYPSSNTVAYDIIAEACLWAMGQSVTKDKTALLVVGVASLNMSEQFIRERLNMLGYTVTIELDTAVTTVQANGYDLVVMSKTVTSTDVSDALKATTAPVIFWEDNQQAIQDPTDTHNFLATIDEGSVTGTAWHNPETQLTMDPAAPTDLAAGLSGTFDFYRESGELTYAPKTDGGAQTLGAGAQRIAEYGTGTQDWWSIYVFEAGSTLADSSSAAGKRGYFGLYDDTFKLLTLDGIALFDDMVVWTQEAVLATPTGWTFTKTTDVAEVTGSWSAVTDAASYDYEVEEWDGSAWQPFASSFVTAPTTTFTLTAADGVQFNTLYRARVRAVPA